MNYIDLLCPVYHRGILGFFILEIPMNIPETSLKYDFGINDLTKEEFSHLASWLASATDSNKLSITFQSKCKNDDNVSC